MNLPLDDLRRAQARRSPSGMGNMLYSSTDGRTNNVEYMYDYPSFEPKPLEVLLEALLKIKVTASTILGAMPTIAVAGSGDVRLDNVPPPTLTVPITGTRYVIVKVTGTPVTTTITTSLGTRIFFHPVMTSIAVKIELATAPPTSADLYGTSGTFKFHLATVVDGTKITNLVYGPVTGKVQDQLDGTGSGLLDLNFAGT